MEIAPTVFAVPGKDCAMLRVRAVFNDMHHTKKNGYLASFRIFFLSSLEIASQNSKSKINRKSFFHNLPTKDWKYPKI